MQTAFGNWSDIRIFLAVMRKGSMLAASRELDIAQLTVARRVEALENEFGLILFERDTQGLHPTGSARAILPEAEGVEDAATLFAEKAQDLTRPRPIRVTGFSPRFASRVIDILSDFSERYPEVRLEVLPGEAKLDLAAGEADIAVRLSRSAQTPDLISRQISMARFTLFGAPSYAARFGLPTRPEDMKNHVIFTFQPDDKQHILHEWLLQYMPADAIGRAFGDLSSMYAAIRVGEGLGIMNLRVAEAEEEAGTLIRCFDPPEELCVPHKVLIAPRAYRRPEVKAFAEYFIPRYAALFR